MAGGGLAAWRRECRQAGRAGLLHIGWRAVCTVFWSSWHRSALKDWSEQLYTPHILSATNLPGLLRRGEGPNSRTSHKTRLSSPLCATNSKIPCKRPTQTKRRPPPLSEDRGLRWLPQQKSLGLPALPQLLQILAKMHEYAQCFTFKSLKTANFMAVIRKIWQIQRANPCILATKRHLAGWWRSGGRGG